MTGRHGARSIRIAGIAYLLLLVFGLVALLLSGVSLSNYIDSVQSARHLELEITDLQFIDDENPRVIVYYRLHNRSALALKVNSYFFELFVNGESVGGSNSAYRGTDPSVDPAIYSQAASIEQMLGGNQHLDLVFTLYIYSLQQDIIRRTQRKNSMTWTVEAAFRVILPHAREEDLRRLNADFEG